MTHPEIAKVTNGLPKKLPSKSLTSLAKTGAVTQVTEVTGKHSPIGREGCVAIGVYFPELGLPGYLSLYYYSYLIDKYNNKGVGRPVTVSVTSGNPSASEVTALLACSSSISLSSLFLEKTSVLHNHQCSEFALASQEEASLSVFRHECRRQRLHLREVQFSSRSKSALVPVEDGLRLHLQAGKRRSARLAHRVALHLELA